jgi:hypothetical protein
VPVAITGGDLEIDLEPIAQAIKEMKERNTTD